MRKFIDYYIWKIKKTIKNLFHILCINVTVYKLQTNRLCTRPTKINVSKTNSSTNMTVVIYSAQHSHKDKIFQND